MFQRAARFRFPENRGHLIGGKCGDMNFRTFEYMFKQSDKAEHGLWKEIGNIYFAHGL